MVSPPPDLLGGRLGRVASLRNVLFMPVPGTTEQTRKLGARNRRSGSGGRRCRQGSHRSWGWSACLGERHAHHTQRTANILTLTVLMVFLIAFGGFLLPFLERGGEHLSFFILRLAATIGSSCEPNRVADWVI